MECGSLLPPYARQLAAVFPYIPKSTFVPPKAAASRRTHSKFK